MTKPMPSLLRARNADEHARVTYAELFFDLVDWRSARRAHHKLQQP